MIKVLYITVGSGGSDIALLSFLDKAKDNGVKPLVVVNNWAKSRLIIELQQREIEYVLINYDFDLWPQIIDLKSFLRYGYYLFRRLIINRIAEFQINKIALKFEADIIHTNSSCFHIGINVADKINIPHIWHIRELSNLAFNLTHIPTTNVFMDKIKSKNNYNIAITKYVYNYLGVIDNISIIYDGVYSVDYAKPVVKKKDDYFLFVGNLTQMKGVFNLIDAFVEFAQINSSFNLYLVGECSSSVRRKLLMKLSSKDVYNRVVFCGVRKDISELMMRATALIVPSNYEAFGLTTAEAMFNKCLVIGKDTSGIKEQFDNGLKICGEEIGIRYLGHQQLVDAMNNVAENGVHYYEHMTNQAFNVVKQLYSKEENVKQIINIYHKILGANKF